MKRKGHPKCWANVLGGCNGKITGEHIITEALFSETSIHVDGASWLSGTKMEIGRSAFTSNILCEAHNGKLSQVDHEVVRLRDALNSFGNPMRRAGSKILQPPLQIHVSGVLFGRWLCKTHCNMTTLTGTTPKMSYIQYAFGERPNERIYFYFPAEKGNQLRLGSEHYTYFIPPEGNIGPAYDFGLIFSGILIIVTTFQILEPGITLIDRLGCLQRRTELGFYKVIFDWSSEPLPLDKK